MDPVLMCRLTLTRSTISSTLTVLGRPDRGIYLTSNFPERKIVNQLNAVLLVFRHHMQHISLHGPAFLFYFVIEILYNILSISVYGTVNCYLLNAYFINIV